MPPGHNAERRPLPPQLRAEAAANPGGSVAEIDGRQVSDPNGYVPAEAIIGAWTVDADGQATGWYLRNPNHGTVRDDFSKLTSPDHWLGWLPADPASAVRTQLATALTDQVAGSELQWVKVTEEATFLTGDLPDADDPTKVTVVRAGLAVPFALAVRTTPTQQEILTGSFSWAATGLHQPGHRRDRTWFDVGASSQDAAKMLESRLYFDRD